MNYTELKELREIAFKVREHIVRMSGNGGCFIGASLSCADIIVYLYKKILDITLQNLKKGSRDYLFLSKGHDVPALYATLAEFNFIDKERLKNHLKTNDNIYWHPNSNIAGIEFHSGSLGHLISVAMGVAYDCRIKNLSNKIVVIMGDGELNEGSVWEAFQIAYAKKLNNLILVIDRNHFQANLMTEQLIPLEPLEKKFEAFGWDVFSCDGNDFESLEEAFLQITNSRGRPAVLIADTIRGKGLPSIEAKADRWFCNFSEPEIENLLNELVTKEKSNLISETLMVR